MQQPDPMLGISGSNVSLGRRGTSSYDPAASRSASQVPSGSRTGASSSGHVRHGAGSRERASARKASRATPVAVAAAGHPELAEAVHGSQQIQRQQPANSRLSKSRLVNPVSGSNKSAARYNATPTLHMSSPLPPVSRSHPPEHATASRSERTQSTTAKRSTADKTAEYKPVKTSSHQTTSHRHSNGNARRHGDPRSEVLNMESLTAPSDASSGYTQKHLEAEFNLVPSQVGADSEQRSQDYAPSPRRQGVGQSLRSAAPSSAMNLVLALTQQSSEHDHVLTPRQTQTTADVGGAAISSSLATSTGKMHDRSASHNRQPMRQQGVNGDVDTFHDFLSHLNTAATKIQRCYRQHRQRVAMGAKRQSDEQHDGLDASNDRPSDDVSDDVSDVNLQHLLSLKKQELIQQQQLLATEVTAKQTKLSHDMQHANQRKRAIAVMKQKRQDEFGAQEQLKEDMIKEEMERVRRKKEKETKRKNKHSHQPAQRTPAPPPAAAHVQPRDVRVPTQHTSHETTTSASNVIPSPRQQSSRRSHRAASPGKKSAPASNTQSDLLAMLAMLESEDTDAAYPTSAANAYSSAQSHDYADDVEVDTQRSGSRASLDRTSGNRRPRSSSRNRQQDSHLQSILTYLEDVEQSAEPESSVTQKDNQLPMSPNASGSDIAAAEAVATANISTFLQQQRQLLEEIEQGRSREDNLKQLQDELEKQKELTIHIVRSQEDEMKDIQRKIQKQSQDYDSRIKKLLAKNDQLVQDNTTLQDQCRRLLSELKEKERRHEQRLQVAAEGHQKELKRQKEVIMAAENMKREKWKSENARKIKEVTVRGLEPEIQRLIAKHKSELREQASSYEGKIRAADERAGRRYISELDELKIRMNVDKESACAKERENARQRFESQLADEEQSMQQRTRRLYAELQEEKEKFAKEQHQLTLQFQEKEKIAQRSRDQLLRQMEIEGESRLEEQSRRHQNELREQGDRLGIERDAWKEHFMRKQEAELGAKERILRQELKQERDKEIEMVIGRLESEMNESQEESQRQLEARMNRLRDQHATEMREMDRSERDAVERYSDMKAQFSDTKAEVARQQVTLAQKEAELTETNKVVERLSKERENVTDIVRQDFANRLVATEEENKRIKTDFAELSARNTYLQKRADEEKEMEAKKMAEEKEALLAKLEAEKQKEMQSLHERIKQAVAKKDDIIANLKSDVQAANKKADHLNSLLQQQRKIMTRK